MKDIVCVVPDRLKFRHQSPYRIVPWLQIGGSRSIDATFYALCWVLELDQIEDLHWYAFAHLFPCRLVPRLQIVENHSNVATCVVVYWVLKLHCAAPA